MRVDAADIEGLYAFFEAVGPLKDTLRSAHTMAGRVESVAEHTWRLALMGALLGPREPDLDHLDVLKLCLIHDLGEIVEGDVPAPMQVDDPDRKERERRHFRDLVAPLPAAARDDMVRLFDDYADERTPEARFVKGIDKLETLITHAQGANPPGFDYAFNLGYGRAATDAFALVARLRELADVRTRARDQERGRDRR